MAINISSGNWLSRSTNLINYNAAYTVMAWVYPNSLSDGCVFGLKQAGEGTTDNYDFWGFLGGSYYLEVARNTPSYNATNAFPSVIGVSQFFHFAAVRSDSSNVQCYENGVAITSPASNDVSARTAIGGMVIGRYNTAFPNPLDGKLCDYLAYSRALSQAEIVNQMRSRLPLNTNNLVDWCPFINNSVNISGGASAWTENGTLTYGDGVLLSSPPLLYPKRQTAQPTDRASPLMLLVC